MFSADSSAVMLDGCQLEKCPNVICKFERKLTSPSVWLIGLRCVEAYSLQVPTKSHQSTKKNKIQQTTCACREF
jgi:hypothetical protein